MKIEELQDRLADLNNHAQDVVARAEAEKRDLSADEEADLKSTLDEFDRCQERLAQLQRFQTQTQVLHQSNRKTEPNPPATAAADDGDESGDAPARTRRTLANGPGIPGGRVPATPRPAHTGTGGFRNLGELAFHVRRACSPGGYLDPRLERLATPTTYGNEGVGADGGFAVPPDFRNAIMTKVMGEDSLISRTDQLTSSSNTLTIPKDETTPWQSTGGIQAYWESEGGLKTQSKPALESTTIRLNKIIALVPVTDELLEDAPALDTYLRRKAPEKIGFKVNLAIVQGTGVGQPLGILNAPSLVTVAKQSSQAADTIVGANIIDMWSRLYAPWRQNAVWLVNQDVESQLYKLSVPGVDNTGAAVTGWGTQIYMPGSIGGGGGGLPTLFGRPVIATEAMETLGDLGDIVLVDLSQYITVQKTAGPKTDVSIHLWFDYDITAYRFVLRVGGQPWWSSTVSPRDGSTTRSWAVALAERA